MYFSSSCTSKSSRRSSRIGASGFTYANVFQETATSPTVHLSGDATQLQLAGSFDGSLDSPDECDDVDQCFARSFAPYTQCSGAACDAAVIQMYSGASGTGCSDASSERARWGRTFPKPA